MTKIIQFTLGMSNGFILQGDKTVLIDAGSEIGADCLKAVFDEHGIDPGEVSLIILSHAHVDHYVNLTNAKALTGAPLMCHEKAAEIIRTAGRPVMYPRNATGEKLWDDIKDNEPVPVLVPAEPDILLCSEISLKPFGIDGQVIFTPGHSDCSLTVLLDSGEAFVGDLILNNPLDGRLALAWFAEYPGTLYRSVDRVLDKASVIYSGHGGPFTREEVLEAYERDKRDSQA